MTIDPKLEKWIEKEAEKFAAYTQYPGLVSEVKDFAHALLKKIQRSKL